MVVFPFFFFSFFAIWATQGTGFKTGLHSELPYIKIQNSTLKEAFFQCQQSSLHLKIVQRLRSRLVAFVTILELRQTVFTQRGLDLWCKMKILWS